MDPRYSRRRRKEKWNALSPGTVVTAAVVAYGAYKLANWAWGNVVKDDDDDDKNKEQVRQRGGNVSEPNPQMWRMRRQRMTRCRDETVKALEGFLLTLRKTVEEKTSTQAETQALKKLRAERGSMDETVRRQQEKELWDVIKVRSVTRMMATAYAHTILFLVLTVQVNLLGGRLFEEQMRTNVSSAASMVSNDTVASNRMGSYQASHKFVLVHTYEYFFERGLVSLIATVERAVTEVLEDWNVLDRDFLHMSRETFDDALSEIRILVEDGRSSRTTSRVGRPRSLLRFLMPPSANLDVSIDDELASAILDETWDLLESPVVADAQKDCLGTTFDMMREQHWGTIFDAESSAETAQATSTAAPQGTTKPLANVLTKLKNTSSSFYKTGAAQDTLSTHRVSVDSYCAMMEALPSVLEMGDVSFN